MAISFKSAVKRAKTLYKSGRYKRFSDAVKAAYKKGGGPSKRQTGKSVVKADKRRKAKSPGKRRSKSGNVYYERRKNRSDKPGSLTGISPKVRATAHLAKACLDYELADTISATKEAQKRKYKWRKELKRLSK